MSRILVVAAHPDDDVLGCGGTIARHVKEGDEVRTLYMADGVGARDGSGADIRYAEAEKANKILGVTDWSSLSFPDNAMDSVRLLDVVKAIETHISDYEPRVIYTHHEHDLNIDHEITHRAIMTACRGYVRKIVINAFEILSCTEQRNTFKPNVFVDITECIDTKLDAVLQYKSEIRKWPHPRSANGVNTLSMYRGAAIGVEHAEAFELVRGIS